MGYGASVKWNIERYKNHPDFDQLEVDEESGSPYYKAGVIVSKEIWESAGFGDDRMGFHLGNMAGVGSLRHYVYQTIGNETLLWKSISRELASVQYKELDQLEIEVELFSNSTIEYDDPDDEWSVKRFIYQMKLLIKIAREEKNPIVFC